MRSVILCTVPMGSVFQLSLEVRQIRVKKLHLRVDVRACQFIRP